MKAISPVIATVIIVAVAIAISIAVALWITGMTSSFTGVEKLEVVNAYADKQPDNSWLIHITVKNTGTKPATIDGVFINGKAGDINSINYNVNNGAATGTGTFTLNPGDSAEVTFYLLPDGYNGTQTSPTTDTFSSGQTVSIVIHTASGGQYPATVTLP